MKSAAMKPRVLAGRGVLYFLLSSGVSDVVPSSMALGAWAVAPVEAWHGGLHSSHT